MLASIIISTFNRARLLERALRSLARQTLGAEEFEVVVVDDGSTDDTARVCEAMAREMPNLNYIAAGKNIGIGPAGNLGISASKGDYLIFTDDDCIAEADWAERMRAALDREPIVAGAMASPTSNFVKLCHNIAEFPAVMAGRKAGYVGFLAGANMGFRRSVIEEVGNFRDTQTLASDTELILRARRRGYRIYFAPDAVVTHDPERTELGDIFRYASSHAGYTISLRSEYGDVLDTPFVLRSPHLLILASPVLALWVTARTYLGNPALLRHFLTAPVVYGLKIAWCWGAARGLMSERSRKGER